MKKYRSRKGCVDWPGFVCHKWWVDLLVIESFASKCVGVWWRLSDEDGFSFSMNGRSESILGISHVACLQLSFFSWGERSTSGCKRQNFKLCQKGLLQNSLTLPCYFFHAMLCLGVSLTFFDFRMEGEAFAFVYCNPWWREKWLCNRKYIVVNCERNISSFWNISNKL